MEIKMNSKHEIPKEISYYIPSEQIHESIKLCIESNNRYLILFENTIDNSKMYIGTNEIDKTITNHIREYYNYNVMGLYDIYKETWEDVQNYLKVADRLREEFDNR